jgi:hypothetical protein
MKVVTIKIRQVREGKTEEKIKYSYIPYEYKAIVQRKKPSPIRFMSKVKTPEKIEDWF